MAFKFNAILNFNGSQAITGMNRAGRGVQTLKKNFKSLGSSMAKVNQGIRSAALATAPFTAGLFAATATAAGFEQQMSAVKAVILGNDEEMKILTETTKLLGATTAFTAKQAAEGAEKLGQAGFSAVQIVDALPGVLDAAAASGVGLAEAATVVSSSLRAFGLDASKAGVVADSLALTTTLSNTTFTELGEAMKFAGQAARGVGLSVAETATAIGVMANAGVRGSLAGTALKNALNKLSRPSKKALELFGGRQGMDKALFRIVDGAKKLLPLEVIMANIQKIARKSKDPLEALSKSFEILGLRGTTTFGAFREALGKDTLVTEKNFERLKRGAALVGEEFTAKIGETIPALVAFRLNVEGAEGTAAQMAKIRLDNVLGQFKLFTSAAEGLGIEIGGLVTGPLKGLITKSTAFLSIIVLGFQAAQNGGKATAKQLASLKDNEFKDMLNFAIEFAQGFIEGFNELKTTAKEVFESISAFLKPIIKDSGFTAKEIGKIVAKIIIIGAIAAPILAGLAAAFLIIPPIISGIVGFIGLVISTIGILVGIAQVAFGIIGAVIAVVGLPIVAIVAAIGLVIGAIFIWRKEIADFAVSAFDSLVGLLSAMKGPFLAFGQFILEVLTFPIRTFMSLLKGAISGLASLLGETLLSKIGLSQASIDSFLAKGPGVAAIDKTFGIGEESSPSSPVAKSLNIAEESSDLAANSLKRTSRVQPPSAEDIFNFARTGQAPNQSQQPQELKVSFTGKLVGRGSDLNAIVSSAKVQQSNLNGRTINNDVARKVSQNGEQLTGAGG